MTESIYSKLARLYQDELMEFGKHRGQKIHTVPTSYLVWAVNTRVNQRQLLKLKAELTRRQDEKIS